MVPSSANPPGLLSFFGVKTGGRLPAYLDDPAFTPIIELGHWAMNDPERSEMLSAVASIPGASIAYQVPAALQVPNGQAWALLEMSASSGAIATGALQFLMGWTPNVAAAGWFPFGSTPLMTPSPGIQATVLGYETPRGYKIIPPGSSFGIMPMVNTVVAATAVNMWLRIVRLQI
jgi:hypothetical protein